MTRLIFLALLVCTAAAAFQSASCGLDCFHNGICEEGAADFSLHPTLSNGTSLDFHIENIRGGHHCKCNAGYTGLLCGVKYEDCSDSDHMCYNGGQCILGLSDIYGNDQLYCDCTNAIDKHGVAYVGKYCEIPKTVTCDEDGEFFCVNGGWCKSDFGNYPRRPCHCGDLHEGPHCEFERGAVPECTLQCQGGGACRRGIKPDETVNGEIDYNFWKKHFDYQYCECNDGFFGLQCEIPSSKCGSHHCFHGGECVTVNDSGETRQYCDCNKAPSNDGVSYAGQFCQYESTNSCDSQQTTNGQLFCVNDGVCHQDGSYLGCDCPSGYHGPICEFKDVQQPTEYENCTLTCENNGQCRNGAKDTSLLDQFGGDLSQYNVAHNSDFEHCVCPDGFVGLTCETKLEVCPDGEHVCLHGSQCVPDEEDGVGSACDCDSGSTSFVMLAGKFCEHQSTSICTSGDSSASSFAFCVNKGECVDVVEPDGQERPGCQCTELYYGPHCEFLKRHASGGESGDTYDDEIVETEPPEGESNQIDEAGDATATTTGTETSTKRGLTAGAAIAIILLVIVLAIAGVYIVRRHYQHKARSIAESIREVEETDQFVFPSPNTKSGRYRDFLGDPDIPDMDSPIRPKTSYHDHVFSNVEIL